MRVTDAKLRLRELTQEVYDIGDEVVEYIEHLAEALADWDLELIEDCRAELELIIDDARTDSRRVVAELAGLRQALTSGLRSGTVSLRADKHNAQMIEPEPVTGRMLEEDFPIDASPVVVRELSEALISRTDAVLEHLEYLGEWVIDQTAVAADDLDALSLPVLYSRTQRMIDSALDGWLDTVADEHPAFVKTMRGSNPPAFLLERARIDACVARVAERRAQKLAQGGGFAS